MNDKPVNTFLFFLNQNSIVVSGHSIKMSFKFCLGCPQLQSDISDMPHLRVQLRLVAIKETPVTGIKCFSRKVETQGAFCSIRNSFLRLRRVHCFSMLIRGNYSNNLNSKQILMWLVRCFGVLTVSVFKVFVKFSM